MTRTILALGFLATAAPVAAQQPDTIMEAADVAWQRGDFTVALERWIERIQASGGDARQEEIALTTGELFQTTEITQDGRSVKLSPDGRWVAYERGAGVSRTAHIADAGTGREHVRVKGTGLVFTNDGAQAAYITLDGGRELRAAYAAMDAAALRSDRQAMRDAAARARWIEARDAQIAVRDLVSGRERKLDTRGLAIASLHLAGAGDRLILVTRAEPGKAGGEVYSVPLTGGTPTRLVGEAAAISIAAVPTGGRFIVYSVQSPGGPASVRLRDVAAGTERVLGPASQLAASSDGSTIAFVRSADAGVRELVVLQPAEAGEPKVLLSTREPIAAPALSPDGRRIAYQRMPRENWELYLIDADGSNGSRLTHEVQHDIAPQFLDAATLLAVMGEGRHRRSYIYDLRTGERRRLFHNNTVRTIAPEYEWVASADGARVGIVAERDGDTVSPERGVYVMDLRRRVTRDALLDRLNRMLASERDLAIRAERMYAPIADEVRAVTSDVSVDRIYGYERDLFAFDSKAITRPGNAKAMEYIAGRLREWGYEPELQWFEPEPGARTANVVATLRGTEFPNLVYVVGSHFDSVEEGPGADDNTSGTAALLEAARVLSKRPLPTTVKFVWFTGEEAGLYGSTEFARRAKAARMQVLGAINNDMVGYANDQRLDNTIRYTNVGLRDVMHAAAIGFSDMTTYDARYYKFTDAHPLFDAFGDIIGGIGSYPVLGNPHYHQSHDVLETINHQLVAEVSKTTIATLMLMATSPSPVKGLTRVGGGKASMDLRWEKSAEGGIRGYIVSWGPPSEPSRRSVTVTQPRASINGVQPGAVVRVKAINVWGQEGWDWARLEPRN